MASPEGGGPGKKIFFPGDALDWWVKQGIPFEKMKIVMSYFV